MLMRQEKKEKDILIDFTTMKKNNLSLQPMKEGSWVY